MASIKSPAVTKLLQDDLSARLAVIDAQERAASRTLEQHYDDQRTRLTAAGSTLRPVAEAVDAHAQARAEARDAQPPPQPATMPSEVPVVGSNLGGRLGISDITTAATSLGGGSPSSAIQTVNDAMLRGNGASPSTGVPVATPGGGRGTGVPSQPFGPPVPTLGPATPGAFDLPEQAPLPETPGVLATLNIQRGTQPTQVGGGVNPILPMQTDQQSIQLQPNVLTAAQRAALDQQRFEFRHEFNLKRGVARVQMLGTLATIFPAPLANKLTDTLFQNGTVDPETLKLVKSFQQVASEQDIARTQLEARRVQIEGYRAATDRAHNLAMESVARGQLALNAYTAENDNLNTRIGLVLTAARQNNDFGLTERGQDLNTAIALNQQALTKAIADDDRAARFKLEADRNALSQKLAELEQEGLNKRQTVQISADADLQGKRLAAASALQTNAQTFEAAQAKERFAEQTKRDKALHEYGMETAAANTKNEYRAGLFLLMQRHNYDMESANLEADVRKYVADQARLGGFDEATVNATVRLQLAQMKDQYDRFSAVLRDKQIVNQQMLDLYALDQKGDQAAFLQTKTFSELSLEGQRLQLERTKAETTRLQTVMSGLVQAKNAGLLTPDRFSVGELMGFDPSHFKGVNVGTNLEAMRDPASFGRGKDVVSTAADAGQFYNTAAAIAVQHNKVLGITDNGATPVDADYAMGLIATAKGFATGATKADIRKAQDTLIKLNLYERSGGTVVPKSEGATVAWANDLDRTFSTTGIANTPLLAKGLQRLGLKGTLTIGGAETPLPEGMADPTAPSPARAAVGQTLQELGRGGVTPGQLLMRWMGNALNEPGATQFNVPETLAAPTVESAPPVEGPAPGGPVGPPRPATDPIWGARIRGVEPQ